MNSKFKKTVYLPVNGEPPLVVCYDHSDWYDSITGVVEKEGYFFTPEQLNEYTQSVIKQTLETAAEREWCSDGYSTGMWKEVIDKHSITNTFEETLKNFEV
jgi:hypothetical protein